MSDNRINSKSSASITKVPESSTLPPKPSNTISNSPKVRSSPPIDASPSLFAQAGKLSSLSQKINAAISLQSVQLIHKLLSEAISKHDAGGLADLAQSCKSGIQGGKDRAFLDQALNVRDKKGCLVILQLANDCFYNSSSETRQVADNIVHSVVALLNSSNDHGQEVLQPDADAEQPDEVNSAVSIEEINGTAKSIRIHTAETHLTTVPNTPDIEKHIVDAIAINDLKGLENLLKAGRVDLNNFLSTIYSPLHFAVDIGNRKAVELLIQYGADINLPISEGITPLHFAATQGDWKTIKILMENGADDEITNERGETPLASAARNDNAAAMQELIDWGAGAGSNLDAMLEDALKFKSQDVAKVLVNALIKENSTVVKTLGRALYKVSEYGGSRTLMRLLVDAGADVNYVHYNGKTPLMIAAKSGHINAVRWLVKHQADPEMTDHAFHTPLEIANKYHRSEVADFFNKSAAAE